MKTLTRALLFLLIPVSLSAQTVSHPLVASAADIRSSPAAALGGPDTISVLAVMVQFQPDTDQRTTGTGTFDTSRVISGDLPVDAPPRNGAYFSDHLTFLTNYFRATSKGRVIVRPTLLSQTITLSDGMGRYSPAKNAPSTPVADLARDTWRKVDSLGLVPDFSRYDAFVVFHAGVGRDIDLVSALGYDPAPLDIPSLFLGPAAFLEAHGSSGIPVRGGSVLIPNSIVLPETESRSIPGISGDVFLEYSINGLLCASFGNFLGLPDLFDTKTGRTAIGRFGLMDGQGIFSFSGVFPPELSAWEKYWLGWIDPLDVEAATTTLSLPAVALADSIYRLPIGPQEYYLLENRNRDPQRNGQRITMVYDGVQRVVTFGRDTTGFNAFDVTLLGGTVTDVEDFDWSLPGGVDRDGTFYDGGLLLWHVDERVIQQGLATNTVNADPGRRGIDLEEADGSQDLGQEYGFLSGGSGSEAGTALDFWFDGNASPVYKNSFNGTTFPSAVSNDGAQSHLSIDQISTRGPRMTARVKIGDATITPLAGFPKRTHQRLPDHALTVAGLGLSGTQGFVLVTSRDTLALTRAGQGAPPPTSSKVYAWTTGGSPAIPGGTANGLVAASDAGSQEQWSSVAAADLNSNGVTDLVWSVLSGTPRVRAVALADANTDGLGDPLFATPVPDQAGVSPVISPTLIGVPGLRGRVHWFALSGSFVESQIVLADTTAQVIGLGLVGSPYSFAVTGSDGSVVLTSRDLPVIPQPPQRSIVLGHVATGSVAAAPVQGPSGSEFELALTTQDGWVYLLDMTLAPVPGFPQRAGDFCFDSPAFADIDGDGTRDIVVFSSSRIMVYNRAGVLLDGFPVVLPSTDTLDSAPVVGDVNGDGSVDIIGATRRGAVVAVDRAGKWLPGFPLAAGTGRQSVALTWAADSIIVCVASHADGSLSAWYTGRSRYAAPADGNPWPQYQRDGQRTGWDPALLNRLSLQSAFFPPSRAYNWPNPAYGDRTTIRYYVRESASVTIRIFDLAGDLVTTLPGLGVAGVDNEVQWDLTGIQSGVYFAHVEASGAAGSGSTIVKIAVVK